MSKRSLPIAAPVDLHDANLVRYERRRDQLTACISAWDATRLTLIFRDVWMVKEFDAVGPPDEIEGGLSGLRECFETSLIAEAKQRMQCLHCSDAEMEQIRHFQLCDDSDGPVLEVIAGSMEILHELG